MRPRDFLNLITFFSFFLFPVFNGRQIFPLFWSITTAKMEMLQSNSLVKDKRLRIGLLSDQEYILFGSTYSRMDLVKFVEDSL